MIMLDKLRELVGHNISINTDMRLKGESTDRGILDEVGDNYIVITPIAIYDDFTEDPGKCYIGINKIMPVIHLASCDKCNGKVAS